MDFRPLVSLIVRSTDNIAEFAGGVKAPKLLHGEYQLQQDLGATNGVEI
jgi:hypothetical protein